MFVLFTIIKRKGKGGSVRGEMGLRMEATKTNPWKADISIYRYGGKHRGFGGNVSLAYMF